ncbi:hypothetical protein MNB_SV-13-678 [hydrothermal vent metagenome]|uniref:Porin domain-containing protein n=1 Tax=hydrothermal vent metagenome TaxID=652676 RepID=A0A1W1CSN2_9ZZZZ
MKKTLLLSVIASTMIMAGGDIAPTEPVIGTEGMAEASTWDYTGQGVLYTQTVDSAGNLDLFGSETTYAGWGLQLGATASDLGAGFGAGVEVSGIVASSSAGFYTGGGNTGTTSGGITQAYLTYGVGSTSVKVGRQQLPKGLSPFAFSEGWQVFKNTFDAALVVNTSIPNTTLVYAAVVNANSSLGEYLNEDSFKKINENGDVVHMVTAQNKSLDGLTLTGSYYFAPDYTKDGNDLSVAWGDAKYNGGAFNLAVQGGQIDPGSLGQATTAMGAKVGAKFGDFTAMAAYSSVDKDGMVSMTNFAGVKSPLYTQMVLNNVGHYHDAPGSEFVKVGATAKSLGGTVKAFYGAGTNDSDATKGDYSQLDLMYVTKLSENVKFFAAYVYTDDSAYTAATTTSSRPSANNFLRFWARYNFN